MQDRKQAFDNISRQLANIRCDIEQHQAIQDYSLNSHSENFFRDIFNCVYDCRFENANFQSANAAYIDLLDTDKKLAYQITSTTSKEKITNTLQALAKPEYQGFEIRMFYLLGKPNLSAKSKQEISTDFAINIDEHLFDYNDLIKDINNLETGKLIALNQKCFKETNQAQNDTTVNITSSTVHGPVAVAEQISNSFNETHHHHYAEKADTPIEVDVFHLPEPTTALIGRKTELAQLTEAIKNPNKRLAIIVATGGIGKSALTDEWLQQIAQENYYGKTRVFGWSFYAQGTHTTYANSQEFFSKVLTFLGISEIPKDEIEKARLLARCLQQQPCLLILDGLEPLQHDKKTPSMNGELQDIGLKEFIVQFRQNPGKSFVLFSSRQSLVEVTGKNRWHKEHFLELPLETLLAPPYDIKHDDGIALLKALEVKGSDEELHKVSKDLNGHALSLVLMGHLLSEHHQGDCRYANELPPLTSAHGDSDAEKDSRHALRVLDYYDSLQDDTSRCFLQLLGLFDRPMNAAEKAVLITNANHAEPLRALTAKQWQQLEQRLEKSDLLLGKKGTFERLEWDTHPIIRGYFGDKFKENYPEAFKQAHLVLFEYFQNLPEKEFPDTLEEMLPLYRAVVHGCLAEKYRQALLDVFEKRIQRGSEYYSAFILRAYSQNITAISLFNFQELENYDLNKHEQVSLLRHISHFYTSLGRFNNAVKISLISLKLAKNLKDWRYAAGISRGLVNLYQHTGQLSEALLIAKQASKYAKLCKYGKYQKKDIFRQILNECRLASILHLSGKDLKNAEQCCKNIEKLWKEEGFEYLITVPAFRYCNLLLETNFSDDVLHEVIKRAEYILLKHKVPSGQSLAILLDKAFGKLILARVHLLLNNLVDCKKYFCQAIEAIEYSRRIEYIPEFYLYRADFYLTQNQLDLAQADLNSAWEIIERCGMKLYAVDYLLIHGRYCLAIKDHNTALNHYEEAKQLIQETGYHLRDAELDLFAAKLRQQCGEEYRQANPDLYAKTAEYYLQKAKNRIAEIGQWGLMRVIERDFPL